MDSLFDKLEQDDSHRQTYRLSTLRQASEMMKLADIRENMGHLKQLKTLYHALQPVLSALIMSDDLVDIVRHSQATEAVVQLVYHA